MSNNFIDNLQNQHNQDKDVKEGTVITYMFESLVSITLYNTVRTFMTEKCRHT